MEPPRGQAGQREIGQDDEARGRAQLAEAGQEGQPAVRNGVDAQREREACRGQGHQRPDDVARSAALQGHGQAGQDQGQDAEITHLDPRPQAPVKLGTTAEEARDQPADELRRRQRVADRLVVAPPRADRSAR